MNLQPSEAQAGFDIRVPPTADVVSLERRIAEEWAPATRNMTFEVRNSMESCYIYALLSHSKYLLQGPLCLL